MYIHIVYIHSIYTLPIAYIYYIHYTHCTSNIREGLTFQLAEVIKSYKQPSIRSNTIANGLSVTPYIYNILLCIFLNVYNASISRSYSCIHDKGGKISRLTTISACIMFSCGILIKGSDSGAVVPDFQDFLGFRPPLPVHRLYRCYCRYESHHREQRVLHRSV